MKKVLSLSFLAFLVLGACQKENPQEYPTPEPGKNYILEGTVNTPGFGWKTKSSVGIYSNTADVKVVNQECKIEGWADTDAKDPESGEPIPYTPSPYEGKAVAPFNTPSMDLVAGENSFFIYSPYAADLSYSKGKIYGLEIAQDQVQPKTNVAGDCFAYGICKGIPGVDAKFPFTLNPVSAIAKVCVKSSELAGYGLKKVTIYDPKGEMALGGGFNVDVNTNTFSTLATYSRISTTVTATEPLTAGVEQCVYINILPGTFAGLTFILELSGTAGTVTIPVQKSEAIAFTGGQTTEIKFEDLKKSDCKLAWYCPEEPRMLSGLGYAYGQANTFLIQCKNGSTYNGATYSANPNIPDEVVIDYRARGNFIDVTDPTGAEFEWFKMPNGNMYTNRTAGYEASNVVIDATKYTFTNDAANYKVTVKNSGSYAGTPILVMKKDGKILWAWTFWNIAADGTNLESISVGNYQFANMDLGQPTTKYDKWIANKAGTNPDVIFRMSFYYQWGRTMPVFWTTYWSSDFVYYKQYAPTTNRNVPLVEGPVTLKEAVENPVGVAVAYPLGTDLPHWDSEENRGALWGGNANAHPELDGMKSIYDPCPKGYRVPDVSALIALCDAKSSFTYSNTAGMVGFYYGGSLFPTSGYIQGKLGADKTDNRLLTMGGANDGTTGKCSHGLLWSNYLGSNKSNQPKAFYYRPEAQKTDIRMATYNASVSGTIRCQVDTDNR